MTAVKKLYCYTLLFFIMLSSTVIGQNTINPDGWNVFRDGAGVVSSEGAMKGGVPDGYWKAYYNNSQLKSEGNWKDGKLDSIWTFYNEQADTTKTISYRNGMKTGYLVMYNVSEKTDSTSSNTRKSEELFLNNVQTGKSYYYDKKGRLQKEMYYDEGLRQGAAKEYDTLGNIITLLEYKKGQIVRFENINRRDAENRKQGRWKDLYPNDRTKMERNYLNDQLHGYVKEFGPTGRLISAKRYNKGELVIVNNEQAVKPVKKETFHDNGEVKTSGSFVKNIPVGTHKIYNEKGEVTEATAYDSLGVVWAKGISDREGMRQGEWEYYYNSGKLKSKGVYIDNNKTGKWQYFYENQKKEQEGTYSKGKKNGEWTWYHENGNLLRIENYRKNKLDGFFIEYTEQGDTITYGAYLDGYREGQWYYRLGDHKETGLYQYGLKDGEWTYYFANGKLKYKGKYNNDLPDGEHLYYYDNGLKRLEAHYRDGEPDDKWYYYDENGLLTITITYKEGEEYKIDGKKILK